MTKIKAQTTDEMKIPGAALASTIKVLAGLGSLGESKEYPSHLRARIFEEIRTRFGKEAAELTHKKHSWLSLLVSVLYVFYLN
ncbi:hypothetical protein OA385_03410 [Paracoccaceae bacterium]|nr:hypothetical protein [Paracoccaceae bacterium]